MFVLAKMADSESTQLSAQKENITLTCKYCLKKVKNKVTCVKCGEYFHPACLKQTSELKKTECKHETNLQTIDTVDSGEITEEYYLKEENKLLKHTITDKNIIISEKCKVIGLLEEKITLLEEKISSLSVNGKILSAVNHDIKSSSVKNRTQTDKVNETKKFPIIKNNQNTDKYKNG